MWRRVSSIHTRACIIARAHTHVHSHSFGVTGGWNAIFERSADFIFMLDVVVMFRTAFYVRGALVLDPKRIAFRYIFGQFWFDLLTALPWRDIIPSKFGG